MTRCYDVYRDHYILAPQFLIAPIGSAAGEAQNQGSHFMLNPEVSQGIFSYYLIQKYYIFDIWLISPESYTYIKFTQSWTI